MKRNLFAKVVVVVNMVMFTCVLNLRSIPREYIPAVDKWIQEQMENGVIVEPMTAAITKVMAEKNCPGHADYVKNMITGTEQLRIPR